MWKYFSKVLLTFCILTSVLGLANIIWGIVGIFLQQGIFAVIMSCMVGIFCIFDSVFLRVCEAQYAKEMFMLEQKENKNE